MRYVISTQYMENYNCDTPGEGEDYFKFKGGIDYLVTADRIQDAVIEVLNQCIESKNVMSKDFPVRWVTYEQWEAQLPEDPEHRAFKLDCLRRPEDALGS